MAQWAKALAVKFDISMIPMAHMGEGELAAASCPLTSVYMLWHTYARTHKITHKLHKQKLLSDNIQNKTMRRGENIVHLVE